MLERLGDAGGILERLRAAAIARSAREMSDLYAVDAVHEFPFTAPGAPSRLESRDAIMEFIVTTWDTGLLSYERYETIAAYTTNDPTTVVVEQDVHGTSPATGPFTLPNLIVLTVVDHRIRHLRDYVNLVAVSEALGLTF
jgi:ketosteroid isomerase-like protein